MTFSLAYRFFTEELNIPVSNLYQQAFTNQQLERQFTGFEKVASETGVTETYFLGAVQDQSWLKTNQASLYDITPTVSEELSKSKDADYPALYVFAMVIAEEASPSRTQLAKMVRFFNRASKGAPVVALFIHRDIFHIAGVERNPYVKTGLVGEKVGKVSLLRDVAQDLTRRHRGHIDILNELAEKAKSVKSFRELYDAWTEVFNISTLNKKFYAELSNWYFWARTEAKINKNKANKDAKDLNDAEFTAVNLIRLITRTLFSYFLKEKGLVPATFFEGESVKKMLKSMEEDENTYYKAILSNVFFASLNQELSDRRWHNHQPGSTNNPDYQSDYYRYKDFFNDPNHALQLFNQIPFLNGGLFDKLPEDGFSANSPDLPKLPNKLFFAKHATADISTFFDNDKSKKNVSVSGLINILNRYKFTVEENTPLEQDIALDPELLGRVFENLLASYNPETQTTARKASGSFYTPREIVEYMTDESLIAYFSGIIGADYEDHLRKLFSDTDLPKELSDELKTKLIQAIDECKIIDPACGSGAFPMGILNRMVFILRRLDPNNEIWKQAMITATPPAFREEFKRSIEGKSFDYTRKLGLIQNCIYGVDIQPIAVQIAKLRCFISLIVDQKPDPSKENFGIQTLPNLEAKFIAANSLIGLPKLQNLLFDDRIKEARSQIQKWSEELFYENKKQKKKQLIKQLESKRAELIKELEKSSDESTAKLLAQWNPFDQNAAASFFDPEWMFGINTGFDIVIGNPPYVQIQKFSGKQEQTDWLNQKYQTYNRMGDIYCLFYEKAWQILRPKGILAFITSNKWMRAGYGESLRNFFATQTNPLLLIDFGGLQVFESATVDTNILIFRREENRNQTRACTFAKDFDLTTGLTAYVKAKAYTKAGFTAESWIIGTETQDRIKQKIEAKGTPLKDWDIQIYRGITTGLNEAFIIDTATKERLCAEDPRSAEILKPILRGKDIKKWKAEWAGLWLLYIPWHFPLQNDPSIKGSSEIAEEAFSKQYPAVYNHLSSFKNELSNRNKSETGIRYEWYALQRWGADYWQEFEKPKIIWKRIGSVIRFSYSEEIEMCLDSTCIAMGEKLKYLTTILNSEMVYYQLANSSPRTGVGDMIISVQALEPLLVIKPDPATEDIFISYFDRILSLKQTNPDADISALEAEVDARVFRLYELTAEEVEVVLAASPASEDQKNNIRKIWHGLEDGR